MKIANLEIPKAHADPFRLSVFERPEDDSAKRALNTILDLSKFHVTTYERPDRKYKMSVLRPQCIVAFGMTKNNHLQSPHTKVFLIFTNLATVPEKARLEMTNSVGEPSDVAFSGKLEKVDYQTLYSKR